MEMILFRTEFLTEFEGKINFNQISVQEIAASRDGNLVVVWFLRLDFPGYKSGGGHVDHCVIFVSRELTLR